MNDWYNTSEHTRFALRGLAILTGASASALGVGAILTLSDSLRLNKPFFECVFYQSVAKSLIVGAAVFAGSFAPGINTYIDSWIKEARNYEKRLIE